MTHSASASGQELACQAEEVALILHPAPKPLCYKMQAAILIRAQRVSTASALTRQKCYRKLMEHLGMACGVVHACWHVQS